MEAAIVRDVATKIGDAHAHRAADVINTPLAYSPALSQQLGCELYLKCEHLQTTGSFKYRGASNKLRLLAETGNESGVVAASSGNHGQAVALAARNAGIDATIYVSTTASPAKIAAIENYGGRLVQLDADPLTVEYEARRRAEADGQTYISPYNDWDVIAGQGTIAAELLEASPQVDAVFVSVGGGGLISGIGAGMKAGRPKTEIVGCWPENAPALLEALEAGHIHEVPEEETLSDGTAGGVEADSITFELCQRVVDATVRVSESAIADAMRSIAEHERWMVEGAAGVALAGLTAVAEHYRDKAVAVILCGRNIALTKFLRAVSA